MSIDNKQEQMEKSDFCQENNNFCCVMLLKNLNFASDL